jgi:membrane-associated phospholipid phosphatase
MAFQLNKIYYFLSGLFVLIAISCYILGEHGDGIIWLSERRTPLLSSFFYHVTRVGEEWTYVFLLIILLFYRFKEALMVLVLAVAVPVFSLSLKGLFAQPRPKRYFTDIGLFDGINLVENIELYAAHTSFPSGHTMSAFAVLGFAAFVFRHSKLASIFLGLLAIMVALSRVYLVQHFLIDVAAGAAVGCLITLIVSWLSLRFEQRKEPWLQKNLRTLSQSPIKD